jgi:integrase/recombinase XerD
MKPLRDAIEDYIGLRRSLGYKLKEPMRELRKFASFMEEKRATHITTALALEWATQLKHALPASAGKRMSYVRGFARHWSATDIRTEVPPEGLLPFRAKRQQPYLYSGKEIRKLLAGFNEVLPKQGLARQTYYCLLGLLVVSGLRISEALNLDRLDVEFAKSMLIVRKTKFGKTRLVPLHSSTVAVLAKYAKMRDKLFPRPPSSRFFLNDDGRQLSYTAVRTKFAEVSIRVGVRRPDDGVRPRLHDLRHRFAVTTLIRWYRQQQDVDRLLPFLSTYLGHVRVSSTYWYLSIEPELMGAATRRLERRWEVRDAK